jgi:hypothetical protein
MKRHEHRRAIPLVLLCLFSFRPPVAFAQDGRPGTARETTDEVLIMRQGEPYDVPPLRIRLLDEKTGEPRPFTPVKVRFVSQWLASSKPDYHGPDGYAETSTDAVTDSDGYFYTVGTRVVPEGLAPAGDDPAFVPRFGYIDVGYEITGGFGGTLIHRETIEAVRSGRQDIITVGYVQPTPRPAASPTEADVTVRAELDWNNSGVRVRRGDVVHVTATGTVSLGKQGACGPEGIGAADPGALLPDKPLGALIAVIGDENDDFIYIGSAAEFAAPHDGLVFFAVNEECLRDNSGAFSVQVRIRR